MLPIYQEWFGDTNRGSRIFYGNRTAKCIRCHSYGEHGGTAGPRLNGVASRLTRDPILEALIEPSARTAPGFGTVTVGLNNCKDRISIANFHHPIVLLRFLGQLLMNARFIMQWISAKAMNSSAFSLFSGT